jgi:hypothetical protein
MEPFTGANADKETAAAANRQRTLFMQHLGRLFMDFVWLKDVVYIANSMDDVASWTNQILDSEPAEDYS